MQYLYIKGMSSNSDELDYLKLKFKKNDVDLKIVINDYLKYSNYSKEQIVDEFKKIILNETNGEKFNLICHSMGCNFGMLILPYLDNVNELILISPEFKNITKEEQALITASTNKDTYIPKENKISIIKKLKLVSIFLKSKKWIPNGLEFINKNNIKTNIYYSKGDKYVSRNCINEICSLASNVKSEEIDCNNHNPLLEENDLIERITADYDFSRK